MKQRDSERSGFSRGPSRPGILWFLLWALLLTVAQPVIGQIADEIPATPGRDSEKTLVADPIGTDAQDGEAPLVSSGNDSSEDGSAAAPAPWVRHLRRAEIVATGTLPLTLLASRLTYSLIRFAYQSIVAGQLELTYAPWFLAPPGSPELSTGEKLGVIGGAVAVSAILALVDYRLGVRERETEQ
jgi:hypothetical protein